MHIMFGKRAQDLVETTHFRAERFSTVNGFYFFSTRENTLEGPFATREEAERDSRAYVSRVSGRKSYR
jgi:hypothetical protein